MRKGVAKVGKGRRVNNKGHFCNLVASGNGMGNSKYLHVALKNEQGFIETQVATTVLIVMLTTMCFMVGIFFGILKEASAKYLWFRESLDFAAQAANVTGSIEEVMLNRDLVREYFELAMETNMPDGYTLTEFKVVRPGQQVPGGIAEDPGYMATIEVPIFEGEIPLIGYRKVDVPMRYFAVVKSTTIN